ncbi:MAG: hypothetical protein C4586_07075 [Anaerolineaceae bacterium]|nr:MAG: hypothetical protein C4586_07075 [Anaerolineaceae bacterium]
MKIIDTLIASVADDVPVRSVQVGAHWTVVCSRHCGMAATLASNHPHGHAQVREAGHLYKKSARELAEYARSTNLLEASIGMAAINSMLNVDESLATEINASEVLASRGRGKKIALVGHFPFVSQLRAAVGQLWVVEQNPVDDDYPAEAAADLIPQADIVAITSSTLINHTLDGLLALCPPRATVMLLGPSTPLSPILYDYGITMLSGTRVINEAAVLRAVGQGASFRQMDGVKLLTFTHEKDK